MLTKKIGSCVLVALGLAMLLVATGCGSDSAEGLGNTGEGGGFLWKPVSESTRKLVVLLPPQYTGRVSSQYVTDGGGTLLDQGAYGGVHNGGREHFRYPKPGAAYGNGVYAVAELKDGTTVNWLIPVGSQRTQY